MTRDAVARRVPPAAVAAIHFGVRDSVSVALLAAGAGVLLLGAALRWRRSAASGLNG